MNWSRGEQYNLAESLHSTFAEFSPTTFVAIATILLQFCGEHTLSRSTLLDCGSGRGRLALQLASQLAFRAVCGIEIDEHLHVFAQRQSMQSRSVFSRGDLQKLGSVRGANIVLAFDRAFGPILKKHLCELFNKSVDSFVFISCFDNLVETAGLCAKIVATVEGSLSGSREKHLLYVYVNETKLQQGPDDTWWNQKVKAAAKKAEATLGVEQLVGSAVNILQGSRFRTQLSNAVMLDMMTLSQISPHIQDAARTRVFQTWCNTK